MPWQEGILKLRSSRITPEEKFLFHLPSTKVRLSLLSPFLLFTVLHNNLHENLKVKKPNVSWSKFWNGTIAVPLEFLFFLWMFSFQSKVPSKRDLLLLSDSLLVEQHISKKYMCVFLIFSLYNHKHLWFFWSFTNHLYLLMLQRKQNWVPCGTPALLTHTDLKVGKKLQYYFFPCPLLLF